MPSHHDVHMLAHTARMMEFLDIRPHAKSDHEDVLLGYQLRWRRLSPEQRAELVTFAESHGNISADMAVAAANALGGLS